MTRRTWEDFSMARRTGTSRTVISSVGVAVAIFAAVMAFESRSMSFDEAGSAQSNSSSGGMAGMNMPGMDMSGSDPTPAPTPTPTPTPSMAADMPGMDMSGGHEHGATTESVSARPLAPVLGTFGGGPRRGRSQPASCAARIARLTRPGMPPPQHVGAGNEQQRPDPAAKHLRAGTPHQTQH